MKRRIVMAGLLSLGALLGYNVFRKAEVPFAVQLSTLDCVYRQISRFEEKHGRLPSQVEDEGTAIVTPCKQQFPWARNLSFGWEVEASPDRDLAVWAAGPEGKVVVMSKYSHDPAERRARKGQP